MKFTLRLSLLLIASLVFFQGCYRDEILITEIPSNRPHKLGVYVLSEGTAAPNQSALSFLSYATGDFNLNITFPALLGLYPDGLAEYNRNTLYVTARGELNSSGKIYKLDTNGIILASNSIGLNPYSIAINNGKAYCTNGPDSSVSVVDINTFAEIKRIKVGLYPQEIIAINNKVFVANTKITGGGIDSTVSVINALNDTEVFRIKVNSASSLAVSKDGYLLVGSSGTGGIIYKINPNTYVKADSFSVASLTIGDINVDYNSNYIYFVSNRTSVKRVDLSTKEVTTFITASSSNTIEYINGYAFDVKSRKHYIADARDFVRPGFLYRFNSTGDAEAGFQTGIAPRRILIRN
jgi:YVTN family beta-propeller protein